LVAIKLFSGVNSVAKYQAFDEYIKGEKIIRYIDYFKRCWNFATDAAEEKFNCSAQSGPTNSGYITALQKTVEEWFFESTGVVPGKKIVNKLRSRLKSVKAPTCT
jgi:hypothetical protein